MSYKKPYKQKVVIPIDLEACKKIAEGICLEENLKEVISCIESMKKTQYIPSHIKNQSDFVRGINFLVKFKMPKDYIFNVFFAGGKISISSQLALSLALSSGRIKKIDEWMFDEHSKKIGVENSNLNNPATGAYCRMVRTDGIEAYKVFTEADAKKAGLLDKDIYKAYLSDMLQHKARIRTINATCPDLFANIFYTNEETSFQEKSLGLENMKINEDKETDLIGEDSPTDIVAEKKTEPIPEKSEGKAVIKIIQAKNTDNKAQVKVSNSDTKSKGKEKNSASPIIKKTLEEKVVIFRELEEVARSLNGIPADIIIEDSCLDTDPMVDAYTKRVQEIIKKLTNTDEEV